MDHLMKRTFRTSALVETTHSCSSFEEQLKVRRADLKAERQKLQEAREFLKLQLENLKKDKKRAQENEESLSMLRNSSVEDLMSRSAVQSPSKILESCSQPFNLQNLNKALRQQIVLASREARDAEKQLRASQDPNTYLKQNLQDRMLVVETLKNLLSYVSSDILNMENEVLELEYKATMKSNINKQKMDERLEIEKKMLILRNEISIKQREALERKSEVESADKKLICAMKDHEAVIQEEKSLNELEYRLNDLETENTITESNVKSLRIEIEAIQAKISKYLESRALKASKLADQLKLSKQTEIDGLIEQEASLERSIQEIHRKLDMQQQDQVILENYSENIQKLKDSIDNFSKTNADLQSQLDSLPSHDFEDLKSKIESKKQELQALKQQLLTSAQIEQIEDSFRDSESSLAKEELKQRKDLHKLDIESNELEVDEETGESTIEDLQHQIRQEQMRGAADDKTLEIHLASKKDAEINLRHIQSQVEQLMSIQNSMRENDISQI